MCCRNFIVNAPGFFSLIWRVAEPMLSPTTRRKIRLLHNKQVWRSAPAHVECEQDILHNPCTERVQDVEIT